MEDIAMAPWVTGRYIVNKEKNGKMVPLLYFYTLQGVKLFLDFRHDAKELQVIVNPIYAYSKWWVRIPLHVKLFFFKLRMRMS